MRGTLRIVVVALLLGVLTNYAAAWIAVLTQITPRSLRSISLGLIPPDYQVRKAAWEARYKQRILAEGITDARARCMREVGYDTHLDIGYTNRDIRDLRFSSGTYIKAGQLEPIERAAWFYEVPPDTSPAIQWFITQAGVPFTAVYGTSWLLEDRTRGSRGFIQLLDPDLPLSYTPRPRGAVPVLPIWPGFIANTLIYAAAWWLVIGLVPLLRILTKSQRSRRRQCIACGYDRCALAPDAPCPECGAPVPQAPQQR
ncbi:MAG TPA: hypothetical protein VK176_04695 [Phycisphaerales bacterium]|nr:hypothetical protein [Phycisphaerales bacterium]